MQIFISVCFALSSKTSLLGESGERKFLLSRAAFGTVSMSCWFTAVKFTKFGDAAAIYYSYPAFISLIAYIFLKEPFGIFNLIVIILTVAGILCVSGPRYIFAAQSVESILEKNDLIGIILASVGCIFISFGNLSIRKIQKTSSHVVVIWFSIISMISSAILLPFLDSYKVPTTTEWLYLLGVGGCGWLTTIFITLAFKCEKAAPVSVVEGFNMIIAFAYQSLIFHESISWTSGLGAILITSSVVAVGYKKWLNIRNEKVDESEQQASSDNNNSPSPKVLPPPTTKSSSPSSSSA